MQLSLVSIKVSFGSSLETESSFGKHPQQPQQYKVLSSTVTSYCQDDFCLLLSSLLSHSFTENKNLLNGTVTTDSSCRHCSIQDCKCLAPAVLSANPLNDWYLNTILV